MEVCEIQENWQQQLDELLALEAICGEDFRLTSVSSLPLGREDFELTPEYLMTLDSPRDASSVVEFEVLVEVELPVTSLCLLLELPSAAASPSTASSASTSNAAASESRPLSSLCTVDVGEVSYLPSINMSIKLGSGYPSQVPPDIGLQAIWLTVDQVNTLKQQLLGLWSDQGPGGPICFTWVDFLKHSALPALQIGEQMVLGVTHHTSTGGLSGEQVVRHLLRYAATREAEAFSQGVWQCGVCFDEVLGQRCIRLPECLHYYCTECLQQDCRIKIKEGAVDSLMCPTPDCRRPLAPSIIKQLLTAEEFKRWEDLLLQRTLDRMQDVVYCPRCQSSVIEEPDHCAQCANCLYVFCSLCNDSWHPGSECMDAEAKLQVMQQRRDRNGDVADTGNLERIRREADLVNQLLSLKLVKSSSRQCPRCQMAIEKTEGCNKMTCSHCRSLFCYRCGRSVSGYEHFGEGCRLFDPEDVEAWEQQMANQDMFQNQQVPDAHLMVQLAAGNPWARLRRCPVCGQQNLKEGQNNAMRCWACHSHFCYHCRMPLRGRGAVGQHFTKSQSGQKPCKQHTDD